MELKISDNDPRPIYEQIYAQIKAKIVSGELEVGHPLPSMRSLADYLHISVITTKRAYNELETEGLIKTVVGRGTFVSKSPESEPERDASPVKQTISAAINDAKTSGITVEEALDLVKEIYSRKD